jgi:carboxyl-terminal processing protease
MEQMRDYKNQQQAHELMMKYGQFIYMLGSMYVDTINAAALTEDAIQKVLDALDPHSAYISAKDAKATNESLQGNFEGVGIEFNILNDTLLVVNPIAGGPSQKAGIRAGDRIVAVDDQNIAGIGLKNTEVQKKLRGAKGTQVKVSILRREIDNLLHFTIVRDKIPLNSITAAYLAAPKYGYINISHFSLTTHAEFRAAMQSFKTDLGKMPAGLILDLRGNSGGILESAIDIADEFLPQGSLILYSEGRSLPRTNSYATDTLNVFEQGKLVVLMDEYSASASEIVAGAVQDWDRGIIIGRRSFGKGLVQNQSELPDGSLIRITVARYHTPTGRVIQRTYEKGKAEQYYEALWNRYETGELYHADSIPRTDAQRYYTLKNKRSVYGGGGIIPDIFIPLDTANNTRYHARLVRTGIVHQFALRYTDRNRATLLKRYPVLSDFNNKYVFTDSDMEELVEYAATQQLPRSDADLAKSKSDIAVQMKGLIAQDLFGVGAYYEVVYPVLDVAYRKALEVLEQWQEYAPLLEVGK